VSFPRYPAYKQSGVEWLEEVPEYWGTSRVRWLCRRYAGGTPDKTKEEYWENGTIPWLNSGAVNDRWITEPSAVISEDAFANSSAKWIPPGALLMALAGQGKTKGMVAQLAFKATCNQSMAALVPGSRIGSRFLYWWLESNYQNIRNMAGGDLRDGLNLELIGNIQCPLPSPSEQVSVSAFLDRETAKIDALIAEQQRLIELLQEKRQAVISQAVTKGLNPDAPMKDSGVEWLGEAPDHWDVVPLKYLCSLLRDGTHLPPSRVDEGIPLLSVRNIQDNSFDLREDDSCISESDYLELCRSFVPLEGDVLLAIVGATMGKVAAVPKDLGRFHIQRSLAIFRSLPELVDTEWFLRVFRSSQFQALLWRHVGYSAQPGIYLGVLKDVRVPLPPRTEQGKILATLNQQLQDFNKLLAPAFKGVALLQERRSALISAAVTGQIDVRGLVPEAVAV
jgi:type I restriction enzyme S subunit